MAMRENGAHDGSDYVSKVLYLGEEKVMASDPVVTWDDVIAKYG